MTDHKKQINRRRFLAAAAGLTAAGLSGAMPLTAAADDGDKKDKPNKIITRTLGRTGLEIPIISMGAMSANDPGLIQAAYENGMRMIDTAATYQYGRNEQMIGLAVEKMGIRDKIIIATKVYESAERRRNDPKQAVKNIIRSCDVSLKRLRTDYVDILYLHDITSPDEAGEESVRQAMTELKKQGKIQFSGISTHTDMAAILSRVADDGFYDVALTSYNFTMADDKEMHDAIKKAFTSGVGLVAMKTMAGGSRWPNPDTRREFKSETIATALIKWVMQNEHFTTSIPGFIGYDELELDATVARDLEFTADERKFLSDNQIKLGLGFCRQCRQCLASCPHDVDIPNLMRTHMYTAQYGNLYHARHTLDNIESNRGLSACRTCRNCTAECAHTVDIPRRIEELKLIYT